MAFESSIEWTESTWNPVTGCTKVSQGCKNCYAEAFAERWRGIKGHPYEQGFDLKLWPDRLKLPLLWKEPRTIFVNSMSDLFHRDVPDEFISKVFEVMETASWHTFQVLTKRSDRLVKWASRYFDGSEVKKHEWPKNIWIGVSVETQKHVDRIDDLIKVPANVRFLSMEPLLGSVVLNPTVLKKIQWVIVGGESGAGARPMEPCWAESIRDQCLKLKVPFFFKQWGAHDSSGRRRGKKASGRILAGRKWDQMPMKEPLDVATVKGR